ncbi:MAG TPA: PP2C family protein-serine/threonine phosphatase [Acidimicrobiales bacterium]|nr:PP2C family protein-serine/threonine phosphatase [Acidimicrobiales bacterium]
MVQASGAKQSTRVGPVALEILLVGLVVVGLLTWASWRSSQDNETRLLSAQAKEAGQVINASVPSVQTPLAAAAELADATDGNVQDFRQFMQSFVGTSGPFMSASLWRLDAPAAGPLTVVGVAPVLPSKAGELGAFFDLAAQSSSLGVTGVLTGPTPRLGYEYHFASRGPFAAYAEVGLPADRRAAVARNAAFSELHYAIYLGKSTKTSNLLATDTNQFLVTTRHSTVVVPFGNSALTLVVAPRGNLGGALAADLPWIIAGAGVVFSAGAAVVAETLQRRRRRAETLAVALDGAAAEARALYAEQRSIAQTLEQALLPESLPQPEGLETASVYEPGTVGVEIGGDWYDLVPLEDGGVFFAVGDVSGRGVRAAAVMARLRFAMLAYARQGDSPAEILAKLSNLLHIEESGHFATAVCGVIQVGRHQLVIANAGHLPPLLVDGASWTFLSDEVGPPIGVTEQPQYTTVTVTVPSKATLVGFTDGLVERKGEAIDIGMKRLGDAVVELRDLAIQPLLTSVVEELTREGTDDDSAILGVRWTS